MAQKFVMDGYTLPTGIMTKGDVTNMQKALGVASDGVWGPKTQAAYNSYVQQRGEAAKYTYPGLRAPIGITTNAGVEAMQNKLGVFPSSIWDKESQDMLDNVLIRQMPHNKYGLDYAARLTPEQEYDLDMLGYEYGIGRGDKDYAMAGFDVPEWLNSKEKVASYQKMLGVKDDGLWGPRTEKAHQELLADIEWTNARQPAATTPYGTAPASTPREKFYQAPTYNSAQGYATQAQEGYSSIEIKPWNVSGTKNMAQMKEPEYGEVVVDGIIDPQEYWRVIGDNSKAKNGPPAIEYGSATAAIGNYFSDTIKPSDILSKAENLYRTTYASYKKDRYSLDLTPGTDAASTVKKMWDRPLPEIIARSLMHEFGYADTAQKRAEACHTLINRMLRKFNAEGLGFTGGWFDSDGNYRYKSRAYTERQFKELLFGPEQLTTINPFKDINDPKWKDAGKLSEIMGTRKAYLLSKYFGESGSWKAWRQACYMGTILAAMFENLQTPGQVHNAFYKAIPPNQWQDLARKYHLVFDGILRSTYTEEDSGTYTKGPFETYTYEYLDDYKNYNDSWNGGKFSVFRPGA